jgi:transposase
MKQIFKEYVQGQIALFPLSLDSKIPQDSPVRLVNEIVDRLDINEVIDTYKGGGTSSYNPRMMLKIVLFAYLNNIYSCRKIEAAVKDRYTFAWLSGNQEPDHNTINRFRSEHLKDTVNNLFTQLVLMLVDMGHLSLDVVYVDGTKLESRANRYTFVWRKSVEKNKQKLELKIHKILKYIDEGIAQDNVPEDDPLPPINSDELKRRISEINRENRTKSEQKEIKTLENKHLPKLKEYENHLKILNNRGSYSKADPDATFMRLKDDHMQNGQLKPSYNLQILTENQFLTHLDIFHNPSDFFTFKPFINGFEKRFNKMTKKCVADAGYGSEENYDFMEMNAIEPFVKFNYFHKEQKKSFKENAFISQNLYYNADKDYFVCPMGQHMEKVGTGKRESESGYISTVDYYQSKNCTNCPLKCLCHKAAGDRKIEINHNLNRHKNNVRQLLTSQEGIYHRKRRPIEPESVFAQSKSNKGYNRFRHFNKDKIVMDITVFAIAFNIEKLFNKGKITPKNKNKTLLKSIYSLFIMIMIQNHEYYLSEGNLSDKKFKLAA